MNNRMLWSFTALGLVALIAIGVVAIPRVLGDSDQQADPTQQQQTVDAAVAERFQQTADALAAQGPALTEAFNATVDASFAQAQTATAEAMSGEVPAVISAANAPQVALSATIPTGSPVQGVAFRPDGGALVTAHADGVTRLWDLASGVATVNANTAPVQGWRGAFSPDGALLATGAPDGSIQLWNAHSGELLATFQGHEDAITGLAFTAAGDLLASASTDGTVRLWVVASAQNAAVLEGHTGGVTALAFSPDGTVLATADAEGSVRLWEANPDLVVTVPEDIPPVDVPPAETSAVTATAPAPTAPPADSSTSPPTPQPEMFPTNVNTQVQAAEQVFENGRMMWIRFNRQIWVMVANEGDPNSGDWYCYLDTFEEGEPEIDPELEPPSEDLIQPRRGFGKIWRNNPDLQEALGWAITPEFELTSNYTYIAGGTIENGEYYPGPGEHRLTTLYDETISFYEGDIRGDCQGGTWHLSQ